MGADPHQTTIEPPRPPAGLAAERGCPGAGASPPGGDPPRVAEQSEARILRRTQQRMGALRAQRMLAVAGLQIAPAVVAGAIAYSHTRRVGLGLLVGIAVWLAGLALGAIRYPLQLMPLAGLILRVLSPLVGALVALVVSAALMPLAASELVTPVLGAWLVLGVVIFAMTRFQRGLEVRIAVIGHSQLSAAMAQEVSIAGLRGYHVVGWVDFSDAEDEGGAGPRRRLGTIDGLRDIVASERIDLVVYGVRESGADGAGGVESLEILERVAAACLDLDIRVIGANQLYEEIFGHVPLATMNAAWFQYVMHPRFRAGSPLSKRLVDLVGGAVAALIFTPSLLIAMIAIRLGDGGPVLYRQRRVGEAGREFEILKLRTMAVSDDHEDGPRWAQADDRRVTRVGRYLRRSHLDEVPQLWNVLKGEMSLVGPRPEQPGFVAGLERQLPYYDRRHLMKPGITGWAQIRCGYAGSSVGTAWKLSHDLHYLKHRSLYLDLMIILETLVTPIRERRVTARLPDEKFVLDAVREELS